MQQQQQTQKTLFARAAAPSFDYHKEVRQFYEDFPEHSHKIFFFEIGNKTELIRPRPDRAMFDLWLRLSPFLDPMVKRFNATGAPAGVSGRMDQYFVFIRRKNHPSLRPVPFTYGEGARKPDETHYRTYLFDHEVGHALGWAGMEHFNTSECVADAYAALRHFQRFGRESLSFLKGRSAYLSLFLFLHKGDEGHHFTTPVIEKIIADSRNFDFSALSPQDTLELAARYAIDYAPLPAAIETFSARYDVLSSKSNAAAQDLACRFARDIIATNHPFVAKWGHYALDTLLSDRMRLFAQTEPLPQTGDWATIRAEAAQAKAAFAAASPLFFGLGKRDKKSNSRSTSPAP